ncbi:MAG: RHS repeat-associated core domain-containing protein [Phycisphaerales bacterium]|nr:RHS repeat-associated core domain-containing protein [Phycisphaerales bacterium]
MVAIDDKLIRRRRRAVSRAAAMALPGSRMSSSASLTRGGAAYQSWNLDSQGNWSSSTTGGTTQTRTTDAQNQITSITGTAGTPQYDSNGNMTTDQSGNTLKYDAWNRLISVTNSSGQVIAEYSYDATSRLVTENYPQTSTTKNLYYSTGWQVLEERDNGTAASDVQHQYVWSAAYTDAMVLRDTYIGGAIQSNNRIYVAHDADWNVTSLIGYNAGTQSWGVGQRFVYDSYGQVTVLSPSWTSQSDAFNWLYLHQGLSLDSTVNLYYNRARWYSPTLGRFISQDPAGYVNGANTYQSELSNPGNAVDTTGLQDYATAQLFGTNSLSPGEGGGQSQQAGKWVPMGPVKVMEKTWTFTEPVANPAAGNWAWLWGGNTMAVSPTVDFEVLVQNSYDLHLEIVGPMEPGGNPEEGTFPPIEIKGQGFWALPRADLIWPNRAHLAGVGARKAIYFVQKFKNTCTGKVETLYQRNWAYGTIGWTIGHIYWNDQWHNEARLVRQANNMVSIWGMGSTQRPSGLAPLDRTPALWANYTPDNGW